MYPPIFCFLNHTGDQAKNMYQSSWEEVWIEKKEKDKDCIYIALFLLRAQSTFTINFPPTDQITPQPSQLPGKYTGEAAYYAQDTNNLTRSLTVDIWVPLLHLVEVRKRWYNTSTFSRGTLNAHQKGIETVKNHPSMDF